MNKRVCLFGILCVSACLWISGCDKTPQNVEINENGVAHEERVGISAENDSDDALSSIPERFVYKYTTEDTCKNIDIPIQIPDQKPVKGKLRQKQIPVQEICARLEPDGTWEKNEELAENARAQEGYETSVTLKNGCNVTRYLAVYDNGVYSGTNGDESIFPISADMVSEKDWSDGQRDYVQDQQAKAESIFQDMGLNFKITGACLWEDQDIRYVTFDLSSILDNITVCDLEGITAQEQYIISNATLTLSDERISEFRVIGNYEIESEKAVNLLNWDQVEQIFEEELQNSDWGEYDLTGVKLEYIGNTDMTFTPVWSFYGEVSTDDSKPLLCINACTGKVEFQWGM